MTEYSQGSDLRGHPDVAEMQARYAKIAGGRQAIAVDGLILLTGLYAAISPWVVHFGFRDRDLSINNLIIGLALAVIGMGLAFAPERMHRLGWIAAPLGVWMIISPWVVPASHSSRSAIIWNNCWVGGVAVALGLAAAAMTMVASRQQRHGRAGVAGRPGRGGRGATGRGNG
jgi:SPW repeat-containing protein